jgi:hypothetical protein
MLFNTVAVALPFTSFGLLIFSSPMQRVQYAKTKSDCIAKEDGTYAPKEKRKKQDEKGNSFSHFHYYTLDCGLYYNSSSFRYYNL